MDFVAVVDQAIALLRQRGRLTYRTLQLQFQLDDEHLEALKDELIEGQRLAIDEAGRVLVWTGALGATAPAAAAPAGAPAPLTYTPPYLAEKILTSRSALEGERKQVTVLFADLKGSMELLADRDPEEARRLLDPVLERMMVAVHRYEGTVNQVMGDGIMALFGAPIAHEDHAVRACYAALTMQEAIHRYSEEVRREHGLEVQIRVGLNSGEVVVRTIGNDLHMDYSAIGQTTHLAARMEQLATPGSILLTAATLRLVEGLVPVAVLGPVPVKGLTEPVDVFELVEASAIRRCLQVSAARGLTRFVGRETELAILRQAALHRGLAHLQAAEFLYETCLFPNQAYTFKHALTHEVAYNGLLQERRRVLHARIVDTFERLAPDRLAEQIESLAHHALRGVVLDKALVYCRQAGEKAMVRSAYLQAAGYFEQALSALPHLPEQRDTREQAIDLRLALRSALRPLGDFERILAVLREAEALAAALDDPRRLGQVARFLSFHFYTRGAYDQAMTAAQRALALATASGEVVLHALANQFLGFAYQGQGDYRRAIDCHRQTVAALDGAHRRERFGLPTLPAVFSQAVLAWYHAELGLFTEGRALGDEGLQMAEASAHAGSLMTAYWGNGLLSLRQGDLSRALPLLERAVGSCQEADLPFFFPRMAAALGAAYTLAGRGADTVPLLTPVLEQTMTKHMVGDQLLCTLALGEAYLRAGRLEEAQALAKRTLVLAREHKERGNEAYALCLLGEIAAHRAPPDIDQAAASYRQALTLAEELGMRPLVAHCHRGLGTLDAHTGQRAQARAELSAANALYRAMEMTFWLPQVETALAQVEGR